MKLAGKYKVLLALLVPVVIGIMYFSKNGKIAGNREFMVKKTDFEFVIETKGEIRGIDAQNIVLPPEFKNRELWVHNFKIKDLVKEGTLVKTGDWVATIDVSELNQQKENNNVELARRKSEFNDAVIDSAIYLNGLREALKESKFDLEYKQYELEQSKYESPAYQRKKKMEYEKTVRLINKNKRDYELRRLEQKMRLKRHEDRYMYNRLRDSALNLAIQAASVKSPGNGILMYARRWGFRKIRIGDNIDPWDSQIAQLPDVSILNSETFVEEIYITKIGKGDSVSITIDALPKLKLTGVVTEIANIGQEIPNVESKVFRTLVRINENNPNLKPGMSTNNRIRLNRVSDVLTIPRECLFSENGIRFVYLKKEGKLVKRKVVTGFENDKEIIVRSGLAENNRILVSAPKQAETIAFD